MNDLISKDIVMRILGLPPPTPKEIALYTTDYVWQRERNSMKGIPTYLKLERTNDYLNKDSHDRPRQVQVYNYVMALKRGGFISSEGRVNK